jgi:hypothetical protein
MGFCSTDMAGGIISEVMAGHWTPAKTLSLRNHVKMQRERHGISSKVRSFTDLVLQLVEIARPR